MKEIKNNSKISIPICFIFVVMIFGFLYFPADAEAKISAGNYLTEIGSKKVCGDRMCDEPLSIAEKIAAFLESKSREGDADQQGRFSEGGVSQQAFVPDKEKNSLKDQLQRLIQSKHIEEKNGKKILNTFKKILNDLKEKGFDHRVVDRACNETDKVHQQFLKMVKNKRITPSTGHKLLQVVNAFGGNLGCNPLQVDDRNFLQGFDKSYPNKTTLSKNVEATVASNNKKSMVMFASGSVDTPTKVSLMEIPQKDWSPDIKKMKDVLKVFRLDHDGLELQKPATVLVSLDKKDLKQAGFEGDQIPGLILMIQNNDGTFEPMMNLVTSVDSESNVIVTGETLHFSEFVVYHPNGAVAVSKLPAVAALVDTIFDPGFILYGGGPGDVRYNVKPIGGNVVVPVSKEKYFGNVEYSGEEYLGEWMCTSPHPSTPYGAIIEVTEFFDDLNTNPDLVDIFVSYKLENIAYVKCTEIFVGESTPPTDVPEGDDDTVLGPDQSASDDDESEDEDTDDERDLTRPLDPPFGLGDEVSEIVIGNIIFTDLPFLDGMVNEIFEIKTRIWNQSDEPIQVDIKPSMVDSQNVRLLLLSHPSFSLLPSTSLIIAHTWTCVLPVDEEEYGLHIETFPTKELALPNEQKNVLTVDTIRRITCVDPPVESPEDSTTGTTEESTGETEESTEGTGESSVGNGGLEFLDLLDEIIFGDEEDSSTEGTGDSTTGDTVDSTPECTEVSTTVEEVSQLIINNYFTGKLMSADDFEIEQCYDSQKSNLLQGATISLGFISGGKIIEIINDLTNGNTTFEDMTFLDSGPDGNYYIYSDGFVWVDGNADGIVDEEDENLPEGTMLRLEGGNYGVVVEEGIEVTDQRWYYTTSEEDGP